MGCHKGCSITDASQIIEKNKVYAGCAEMEDGIEELTEGISTVSQSSDLLSKNNLMFGAESCGYASLGGALEDLYREIEKFKNEYSLIPEQIRSAADQQYEEELEILRYHNQHLAEEAAAARRAAAKKAEEEAQKNGKK